MYQFIKTTTCILSFLSLLAPTNASCCTRTLFTGMDETVITGRSMDWVEDMHTNLWVFPQGMDKNGEAGANSIKWKSKYGSLVSSVYNLATADGINEKGLVMSMLYLAESDYGKPKANHPLMSISIWGQYALDNFATVNEAVEGLKAKPFNLIAPNLPNGTPSTVHLALSDASGDSAIFEYIKGELVIHHGKEYTVMTNSPTYEKQLALNEYWKEVGWSNFLPGTSRAADRFARAYYYINTAPKTIDKNYIQSVPNQSFNLQAIAEVMSIMRAVSVPFGLSTPKEPNIASTLWRTASDHNNLFYYFDSATSPNTFWVSLKEFNFKPGAPTLKLDLENGHVYSGETSKMFKPAPSFKFLSTEGTISS